MNSDTVALLKECTSGCQMAMENVKQMRQYAKNSKLDALLEAYGEKHRKLEGQAASLLKQDGQQESSPKVIAEMMADTQMQFRMLFHHEDKEIAKIMMDGCNMGIQSVSGYLNKYGEASAESQAVARKLIDIEENFMQEMKDFV